MSKTKKPKTAKDLCKWIADEPGCPWHAQTRVRQDGKGGSTEYRIIQRVTKRRLGVGMRKDRYDIQDLILGRASHPQLAQLWASSAFLLRTATAVLDMIEAEGHDSGEPGPLADLREAIELANQDNTGKGEQMPGKLD